MDSAADLPKEGFPHSDIRGSTIARISPRLFAACHVLHRLLAPRHPPNALVSLAIPTQPPARSTKPRTNQPSQAASLTLSYSHSIPRFTCQRSAPARTSLHRGGLLEAARGRTRRSWRRPARCLAARRQRVQVIERRERSRTIRQVVLFRKVATRVHPHPASRTIL